MGESWKRQKKKKKKTLLDETIVSVIAERNGRM